VGSEEAGQRGGPGAHNHGAREGTSSGNDSRPWGGRRQIAMGLGTGAIVGIVVGGFFGVVGGAAAVYVLLGWSSRERINVRNSRQQGLGDSGAAAGVSGAIMYVEGVDGQGNLVLTPAFGNDTVNMSTSSPQYNDKVKSALPVPTLPSILAMAQDCNLGPSSSLCLRGFLCSGLVHHLDRDVEMGKIGGVGGMAEMGGKEEESI
jgi:hypothetical protein